MAKHILIFSLTYDPFIGGAEVALKEITNRISPSEVEFSLITGHFDSSLPKEERIGNVSVYRVGWGKRGTRTETMGSFFMALAKILYIPLSAWRGVQLHREKHFDGAWAEMSYMVFPLRLMRLFGVRIPYVITLQEGDPFEHVFQRLRLRPFRPLLRAGFREATVVQAISTFLGEWSRQVGFQGPLEIIPNGVSVSLFSREVPREALYSLKEKLHKKEGDVYLVTTSRLVHKNALDDVIRALALLPDHIHFLIIGTGPDEKSLRKLATEEGVESRTHFRGHIPYEELPLYLQASDIFIRPSRSEGMGNSFIEAMAAGLPVIATQEGGIADFLFDAQRNLEKPTTGFAVSKNSPREIADAVLFICSHRDNVEAVIHNARTLVEGRYEWNTIAHEMKTRVFDRVTKEG